MRAISIQRPIPAHVPFRAFNATQHRLLALLCGCSCRQRQGRQERRTKMAAGDFSSLDADVRIRIPVIPVSSLKSLSERRISNASVDENLHTSSPTATLRDISIRPYLVNQELIRGAYWYAAHFVSYDAAERISGTEPSTLLPTRSHPHRCPSFFIAASVYASSDISDLIVLNLQLGGLAGALKYAAHAGLAWHGIAEAALISHRTPDWLLEFHHGHSKPSKPSKPSCLRQLANLSAMMLHRCGDLNACSTPWPPRDPSTYLLCLVFPCAPPGLDGLVYTVDRPAPLVPTVQDGVDLLALLQKFRQSATGDVLLWTGHPIYHFEHQRAAALSHFYNAPGRRQSNRFRLRCLRASPAPWTYGLHRPSGQCPAWVSRLTSVLEKILPAAAPNDIQVCTDTSRSLRICIPRVRKENEGSASVPLEDVTLMTDQTHAISLNHLTIRVDHTEDGFKERTKHPNPGPNNGSAPIRDCIVISHRPLTPQALLSAPKPRLNYSPELCARHCVSVRPIKPTALCLGWGLCTACSAYQVRPARDNVRRRTPAISPDTDIRTDSALIPCFARLSDHSSTDLTWTSCEYRGSSLMGAPKQPSWLAARRWLAFERRLVQCKDDAPDPPLRSLSTYFNPLRLLFPLRPKQDSIILASCQSQGPRHIHSYPAKVQINIEILVWLAICANSFVQQAYFTAAFIA
ncbi:uncharacterized protein CLUP02_07675 [Colletotrichum lupini]|uniref:Uncharacterized protein n=1 Tax=Colletotrichum lupini TaxID=145971 RepID=A0A9Q8SS16_9PEZI|nr:uncharacterized protein CLUP02_07675 [Colletotrichum lupini]UQC82188.1 hypothetical protein CLUP02_07675 [Colletotrichum lupini]